MVQTQWIERVLIARQGETSTEQQGHTLSIAINKTSTECGCFVYRENTTCPSASGKESGLHSMDNRAHHSHQTK